MTTNAAFADAVIFSGSDVKTLKPNIDLFGESKILSGDVDPSGTTTSAPIGSIYLNNTNGNTYRKLDAGSSTNWILISSGSVSGINYIANPDAEAVTTGWATYADAAATSPVDGTGGSPNSTFTRSTSTPLRGTGSFLWTKSANNRQGEGFSYAFTINEADKYKVLQGSFDYAIASGTFVDDDMSIWIYDVTNAALIQPAPYLLKNHALPSERMPFEFQATGSTSYRLIVHTASTSASAYTVKLDNVVVGPQAKLYGSSITDSTQVTPALVYNGTYNTRVGWWWREGQYMRYQGYANIATSGSAAADVTLTLPGGYSIDTAKAGSTVGANFGGWGFFDNGGGGTAPGWTTIDTSTSVKFVYTISGSDLQDTQLASGDRISWNLTIPISGWYSTSIMSNDANTTAVASQMTQSGNQTGFNPNNTAVKVQFETTAFDSVAGNDLTNDRISAKSPGFYDVDCSSFISSTNVLANLYYMLIYKNGSVYHYGVGQTATAGNALALSVSTKVPMVAGDYVECFIHGNGNNSASTLTLTERKMSLSKVSGPNQIAASESVVARYKRTGGSQSISTATQTIINFDTKDFDSHNAVTTGGSWKFTSPSPGTYRVSAFATQNMPNCTITAEQANLTLFKNGAAYAQIAGFHCPATANIVAPLSGSTTVKLLAGDYVDLQVYQDSGSSQNLDGSASGNFTHVSIERIGNY